MNGSPWRLPVAAAALAVFAMLGIYLGVLTLLSGGRYAVAELRALWFYIVPLAAGFGVQVGLFIRLKQLLRQARHAGALTAASGGTSTLAMLSCCAHYVANVAPALAATGLVSFAAQYQVSFFWVGMAFNAAGIAFIASRLRRAAIDHSAGRHGAGAVHT